MGMHDWLTAVDTVCQALYGVFRLDDIGVPTKTILCVITVILTAIRVVPHHAVPEKFPYFLFAIRTLPKNFYC